MRLLNGTLAIGARNIWLGQVEANGKIATRAITHWQGDHGHRARRPAVVRYDERLATKLMSYRDCDILVAGSRRRR